MIQIFTSKTPPENHNIIWLKFLNNKATLNIFIGDDWQEIGSIDIDKELKDIIDRIDVLESKINNPTDSSEIVELDDDGVYITDENLYPVIQYNNDGFDTPKLSTHFMKLLGGTSLSCEELKLL